MSALQARTVRRRTTVLASRTPDAVQFPPGLHRSVDAVQVFADAESALIALATKLGESRFLFGAECVHGSR